MASRYAAQIFGESFNRSYELQKRLRQAEEEFNRNLNFQERQLSLGEAFRRDELTQRGRYYDIQQETNAANLYNDYVPVPEGTPNAEQGGNIKSRYPTLGGAFDQSQSYLDKDLVPPTPQPIKYQKVGEGEDKGGKFATVFDPMNPSDTKQIRLGSVTPSSSETGGGGKLPDISNEVGEVSKVITLLDQLESTNEDQIEYENNGNTVKVDKTFLRAEGKRYSNDMLTKAGIPLQGDLITEIREKAGVSDIPSDTKENAKIKRQRLLETIDYVRSQGKINDAQYEALRYWAHIGTR